MPESANKTESANSPGDISGSGCLLRLGWMLLGPAALVICIMKIIRNPVVELSFADAVFWGVVIIMAVLKRVDITKMHGRLADDRPATLEHWRRYLLILGALAVAVWAGAHGIAWYQSA
ncbi:MAG: hypothetical protein ABFD92_02225 [Planctomycetaceae bacterium]|nr:hypothetical protein [Planctomycetaceae bacterium]